MKRIEWPTPAVFSGSILCASIFLMQFTVTRAGT